MPKIILKYKGISENVFFTLVSFRMLSKRLSNFLMHKQDRRKSSNEYILLVPFYFSTMADD